MAISAANTHIREFESLRDLLDYANGPSKMRQDRRSSRRDATGSTTEDSFLRTWYGSPNYASAERIALNWAEGADKVTTFRATINKNTRVPKKVTLKSVVPPGVINIGAVVSGEPETYYRRDETLRLVGGKGKVVKMIVDASANCDVKAENMQRRGAAVLALIDSLEKIGRRVELTMVWANNCSGHLLEYRLLVKRASQRVSLNAMAFSVSHPSMFRRVIFSAMEVESPEIRRLFDVGGYYGHAGTTALAEVVTKGGGIYISNDVYHFETDKRAQDWVVEQAKAQGITLKERRSA